MNAMIIVALAALTAGIILGSVITYWQTRRVLRNSPAVSRLDAGRSLADAVATTDRQVAAALADGTPLDYLTRNTS